MDKFHSRRQSLLGRNLDNTIHRINHYPTARAIYPVDGVIQSSKNWGQLFE